MAQDIVKLSDDKYAVEGGVVVARNFSTEDPSDRANISHKGTVLSSGTSQFTRGLATEIDYYRGNTEKQATGYGEDAIIYYGPEPSFRHALEGLNFIYSDSNANSYAVLTVESPSGTPIFGPMPMQPSDPQKIDLGILKGPRGADMAIRLSHAGQSGFVSTIGHRYI